MYYYFKLGMEDLRDSSLFQFHKLSNAIKLYFIQNLFLTFVFLLLIDIFFRISGEIYLELSEIIFQIALSGIDSELSGLIFQTDRWCAKDIAFSFVTLLHPISRTPNWSSFINGMTINSISKVINLGIILDSPLPHYHMYFEKQIRQEPQREGLISSQ